METQDELEDMVFEDTRDKTVVEEPEVCDMEEGCLTCGS